MTRIRKRNIGKKRKKRKKEKITVYHVTYDVSSAAIMIVSVCYVGRICVIVLSAFIAKKEGYVI